MKIENEMFWAHNYSSVIDNLIESVVVYDIRGNIIDWNEEALREFGYSNEEFYNIASTRLFPNEFYMKDYHINCKTHNEKESITTIGHRKNGTCFACSIKMITIHTKKTEGIIIIHNIQSEVERRNEIQQLKNELKGVKAFRQEYVANVTHELRTPLNGIMGHMKLVRAYESNEQKESFEIMERCCSSMERIIKELLDYAKLQSGRLEFRHDLFDLSKLIDTVEQLYRERAREKGIKFGIVVSSGVPKKIVGDSDRLEEVLCNLLDNAIKFTEHGEVTLEVAKVKESEGWMRLLFVIKDTGIGIREVDKEKLFHIFSQVDPSITRKYGGTGLGLSICKTVVEKMGGKIYVDSEYGRGSRFYFTITVIKNDVYVEEQSRTKAHSCVEERPYSEEQRPAKTIEDQLKSIEPIETLNSNKENKKSEKTDLLKRIRLCIEMESWERAEQCAEQLKLVLQKEQPNLYKIAFRMILTIRKQEKEKSFQYCDELEHNK